MLAKLLHRCPNVDYWKPPDKLKTTQHLNSVTAR